MVMASYTTPLPSNPCLVAILLVVNSKSRSGSDVIFHYPPNPKVAPTITKRDPHWYGTPGLPGDESDTSSESDHSDDNDEETTDCDDCSSKTGSRRHDTVGSRTYKSRGSGGTTSLNDDIDEEMPVRTRDSSTFQQSPLQQQSDDHSQEFFSHPPWNTILGLPSSELGGLLSPDKFFNKHRFEVSIDEITYVGAPVFVREDGLWKKPRRKKGKHKHQRQTSNLHGSVEDQGPTDGPSSEGQSGHRLLTSDISGFEAGYGHSDGASDVASEAKSESTSFDGEKDMTMFNLVFVMNPPALEYQIRVSQMYECVVKKFAKALKYAQAMKSYVYHEQQVISQLKDRAKEHKIPMSVLWPNIIEKSSLAQAIAITFNSISIDKIAHVNLGENVGDEKFDSSFQIPLATSTKFHPTYTDPQMPGLWLTTSTIIEDEDRPNALSPNSALLLLEDDNMLLKEVEADMAVPLSHFVQNLTPTKPLKKIAAISDMSLQDVMILAKHLVYWRRARAIPPIKIRDYYVVSPNCNLRSLKKSCEGWTARFPRWAKTSPPPLPSLPEMLQALSEKPKPWARRIPPEHPRTLYVDMLAWLLRHGWVTQLRRYGWIRVSPEVKAAVAVKDELDRRQQQLTQQTQGSPVSRPSTRRGSHCQSYGRGGVTSVTTSPLVTTARARNTSSPSPLRHSVSESPENSRSQAHRSTNGSLSADPQFPSRTASPLVSSTSNRPASDAGSVLSDRTAITIGPPLSPLQRSSNSTGNSRSGATQLHGRQSSPLSIRPTILEAVCDTTTTEESDLALDSMSSDGGQGPSHVAASVSNAFISMPLPRQPSPIPTNISSAANYSSSLVSDPMRPKALESDWLKEIGSMLEAQNEDWRDVWPVLFKYFNGTCAFEDISVLEGWSKKFVSSLIAELERGGWLVTFRHW